VREFVFPLRSTLIILFVAMILPAACCDGADILYFTSAPASWVGAGQTKTLDASQGASLSAYRYQGAYANSVNFYITQGNDEWYVRLIGPDLTLPVAGDYPDAERWTFQSPGHPGLVFLGQHRADNTLTGNFTVLDAAFDGSGNPTTFAADFTQYDEGNLAWWNKGSIRYHSSIPIPEPASCLALTSMVSLACLRRWRLSSRRADKGAKRGGAKRGRS